MADTARLAAALGDRYRIERELGAGGMATVYLARDLKHDREVAVKVLRPELGLVLGAERFLAEIKITARLDHPHILTLIDSGSAEGLLFYVLPYARGESLRARIDREHQLGIEDALTIVKQIASALDYAHRHGVVHRDIKPENILIQEGEAMLADFGIALAVKEAGGNRLTESGLSLGTPQYMSPEQATGERQLDARSDVYSLAAVFYEMIAGEPPVTGATAQAMIAKLLTERPTPLQVVRDTVPSAASAAVAKALAKTPADRFASAGDFVRVLTEGFGAGAAGRGMSRTGWLVLGGVGVAAVAVAGVLAATGRLGHRGPAAVLGDKTQLTVSGAITIPAISPDGKQLAYVVKHCRGPECTYDVTVQDVGGTLSRVILPAATAAYALSWSPDRRNLLFAGSIQRRFGGYVLSVLGGPPRLVSTRQAAFYGEGDSLLVAPPPHPDSAFWLQVTTLDGIVRDSIRVPGPGVAFGAALAIPGTSYILTQVAQPQHALWQIIDRKGHVVDRVVNSCWCPGVVAHDAIWLARSNLSGTESVIRIGMDPLSGRLSHQQDTMFSGLFTGFSVTADGAGMVIDQGTYDYSIWAVDLADALSGRWPESRRIAHSSTWVHAVVSPDGRRLLMERILPALNGMSEERAAVRPWEDGPETPLALPKEPDRSFWADSVTLAIGNVSPKGHHFALLDVRSGATRQDFEVRDSLVENIDLTNTGWAWVPLPGDSILVQTPKGVRSYPHSPWFAALQQITPDAGRTRLAYTGWRAGAVDSLGVHVLNLADGSDTRWGAFLTEGGGVIWLNDGSLLMISQEGVGQDHLYRLRASGSVESLGTVPRELFAMSVSADLRRATVETRDYHADAWLTRVVRP